MNKAELNGYAGKILKVDLGTKEFACIDTMDYAGEYIGGRAIAQRLYWELVKPEISAFDPENCLIFMTGVLTGTGAPSSSRMTLVGKSPATYPREINFCSNMAGGFGPALKRAGYDGLIVTGQAERPVYLLIQEGKAELRDAADLLWGLDTFAVKDCLWRRHGKNAEILTIGQAGENLVREAIIQSSALNSFSQGGFGAVMGSKRLKAVVAAGKGKVSVAEPEELLDAMKDTIAKISKKETEEGKVHQFRNNYGVLPSFLAKEVKEGKAWMHAAACESCALACMTGYKYLDGAGAGVMKCSIGAGLYNKGEYNAETMEAVQKGEFVPILGRDSLLSNPLWERYGVNAHFLEMFSQGLEGLLYKLIDAGILTEENTGLPMDKIGKPVFAQELLKKVVFRENEFGSDMAEGPARFCEKWGPKAMELWHENYYEGEATLNVSQYTIKNGGEGNMPDNLCRATGVRIREVLGGYMFFGTLESHDKLDPCYSDRELLKKIRRRVSRKFIGIENACDDPDDYEYAPILARYVLCQQEIMDMLGQCAFVYPILYTNYSEDQTGELVAARFLNAVTGAHYTEEELAEKYAMRAIALERAIMAREGRSRKEDKNPDVMFTDHGGAYDRDRFEDSLTEFYKIMHWDESTGYLKESELARLGLGKLCRELQNCGKIVP